MNNELKQANEIKIITYLCDNLKKDGFHINVDTKFSSHSKQSRQDVIDLFKANKELVINVYDVNNENEISNIFITSQSGNDGTKCIMFVRLDKKLNTLQSNVMKFTKSLCF